ncbi:MAG TPA: LUD domain-containing protein [Polyangiaceae bacterium]|jgi:L-lactate dehydrogenase complex protein LldG|nr:LUD domain-containing protein [Polyangiaceae bacterium]
MNDDRELVFERIRQALSGRSERAPRPEYADELMVAERVLAQKSLMEAFAERLSRVRGVLFQNPSALASWLAERGATRGYVDPALLALLAPNFAQGFRLETELDRNRIDDYTFGITRAVGAIAETGTVVLNDEATSRRLGALAPWVHIAVVRESTLFRDVAQAIRALGDDPNVIWCTGPSKTADVEGILIEGVHGPGEQGVLFVPQFSLT